VNLYQTIGFVAQAWLAAARASLRAEVWTPLLVLTGVQSAVLLGLIYFYVPGLSPIAEPLVRGLGGEIATHYPDHYWALPAMFRNTNVFVTVLVGSLAFAVATLNCARAPGGWVLVISRAPALISLALLGPGLAWIITSLFNLIPLEVVLRSFVIRLGLQGIELGIIVIIQSMLAYGIAFVVLADRPLGAAISGSFHLARLVAIPTLILVAAPLAILFPPTFFLLEMDASEKGLIPESVALIMGAQLLLRLLLNMLLVGSLTHVFMRATGVKA
jgi:hypothetical protein